MEQFAVILVHGTSHAIQVERVLRRAGLTVKLVPTPRHLSSGMAQAEPIRLTQMTEAAG